MKSICTCCNIVFDILGKDQYLCITCLKEWENKNIAYDSDKSIDGIDWDSTNKMMPDIDFSDLEETKCTKEPKEKLQKQTPEYYGPDGQFMMSTYKKMNKEKLNKRKSQKIKCLCGKIVRRDGLSLHKKSKYHINTCG